MTEGRRIFEDGSVVLSLMLRTHTDIMSDRYTKFCHYRSRRSPDILENVENRDGLEPERLPKDKLISAVE